MELFPGEFGLDVHGDKMAEFVYPALSPLPDELWLAPIQDGVADMAARRARALRVPDVPLHSFGPGRMRFQPACGRGPFACLMARQTGALLTPGRAGLQFFP